MGVILKKLNRIPAFLLLLVFVISLVSCAKEPARIPKDCVFFPSHEGDKWVYDGTVSKAGVGSVDAEIVAKITGTKEVNFVKCAIYTLYIKNKPILDSYYEVSDKGVYLHRNVSLSEGEKNFDFIPALLMLKVPLVAGDVWEMKKGGETFNGANKGLEFVSTRLGKYTTYRVEVSAGKTGAPKTVEYVIWYAENVGVVKETIQVEDIKISMLLRKFTIDGKTYPAPKSAGKQKASKSKKAKGK